MKQEQGERNWLGRVIDRARTNLHRTDSAEYAKRALIDSSVALSSAVGFTIEILSTGAGEAELLWLVPAVGGIMAAAHKGDLLGNAREKEWQAELDEAVNVFQERLCDEKPFLGAQLDFVEGYELLQNVADTHGISEKNIFEAFVEKHGNM